jgi:hypothetical protein
LPTAPPACRLWRRNHSALFGRKTIGIRDSGFGIR